MGKDPLKIAQGELGNTESPAGSNRTRYGAWYGLDGQPWCMMFVQWCFDQAERPLPYKTASCSGLLSWYRKYAPERIAATPQPRDIIIYNFGHTGIVESVQASAITAIEGNTSAGDSGSQDNGGGVFRRTRSKTLATAYIRPFDDYEEENEMEKRYNTVEELPGYAKATIRKLIAGGGIRGSGAAPDQEGNPTDMDLSLDMIRMLVINDQMGMYDLF